MLPIAYATRNLLRDPSRLLQKVIGAALVVFLVLAASAFNDGMVRLLSASGSPHNVMLIGSGSEEAVERSELSPRVETLAAAGIQGIAKVLGTPAVSGEIHYMGKVFTPDGGGSQGLLRGVTPEAFLVHQEVQLLEGRPPGSGEVMVGRYAHRLLGLDETALEIGQELYFEEMRFRIVGRFAAPGTVMESELWLERSDLQTAIQRDELSCVVIRMEELGNHGAAQLFAKQRFDLEISAVRETVYYARLSEFFGPIRGMVWLTAALIGAGAVFGGFNVFYAAYASRVREMATLQAVGFSRFAILVSMITESLLTTFSGTLLATWLAIWLIEGVTVQFSVGAFELLLSAPVVLAGLLTGLALGFFGCLPPAWRCLCMPLPAALRS